MGGEVVTMSSGDGDTTGEVVEETGNGEIHWAIWSSEEFNI